MKNTKQKYTVFFEQTNRINYQVTATNEHEARTKVEILYKRERFIPSSYVQYGWISNKDGEDK